MKVLLFNGSPHKNGCTYTALQEIANTLKEEGIDSEIYQIGTGSITPCRACYACAKIGKCVINDDKVNEFVDYAADFDGYIFGSPVHFGSACGGITAFLDRAFFVSFRGGRNVFPHKPAAAIVSARRAGTTAALDQLNKYFMISQMPVIDTGDQEKHICRQPLHKDGDYFHTRQNNDRKLDTLNDYLVRPYGI